MYSRTAWLKFEVTKKEGEPRSQFQGNNVGKNQTREEKTYGGQLDVMHVPLGTAGQLQETLRSSWSSCVITLVITLALHRITLFLHIFPPPHRPSRKGHLSHVEDEEK